MAEPDIEPQDTIRLEDYLRIAWSRAWIIILAVLIVVIAALVVSLRTEQVEVDLYNAITQKIAIPT